jgi:zinc protease
MTGLRPLALSAALALAALPGLAAESHPSRAGTRPAQAVARPARQAAVPDIPYERFTLSNGLRVILHEDHAAPIAAVHVEYDVGSKNEKPGRTGFAHLFEHLMFQGSQNLPKGEADRLLDAAGGEGNGQTSQDATQYWEQVPSNALEQVIFAEADRMGFLLPTLTQEKLDNQREVVRNERRETYEMQPYGLAYDRLFAALWEPEFPYHWLPIGSHADLQAATLADVKEFFTRWYGPENAAVAIAGDIDPAKTREMVERWFGAIPGKPRPAAPRPKPAPPAAEKRLVLEDRVQLPRLYLAWQTPAVYAPGDAALDVLSQILSSGKSARLVKRLVIDERIAQNVSAGQSSLELASVFVVVATPKPGVPVERIEKEIDEEIARIAATPPTGLEMERAKNKIEAGAVFGLEQVSGRAALLAGYEVRTGDPGFLGKDLARYRALTARDVQEAARTWLRKDARVVLTVVPRVVSPGGSSLDSGPLRGPALGMSGSPAPASREGGAR